MRVQHFGNASTRALYIAKPHQQTKCISAEHEHVMASRQMLGRRMDLLIFVPVLRGGGGVQGMTNCKAQRARRKREQSTNTVKVATSSGQLLPLYVVTQTGAFRAKELFWVELRR
jgi:hypothetical protein